MLQVGLMEIDPERIVAGLRKHGYVALPECLSPSAVETLDTEFERARPSLPAYSYPFGDQYRVNGSDMKALFGRTMPATCSTLLTGPLAEVCTRYGADEGQDLLVWSHEFNRDPEAIYGIPHFDRRHQLKIFVYLTDVDVQHGPTHVADEDPSEFHARWLDAWRSALGLNSAGDNEVLHAVHATSEDSSIYRSVACQVDLPRTTFRPLTGNAGTIVIFDTSLAHFGGLISDSASARRTVRRHCLLD